MPITRAELASATKDRVRALFGADSKTGAAAGTASTTKYVLPNEDLGIITEMLNEENPLAVYSGVTISGQGSATVEVKYDIYNDNWKAKDHLGSAEGKDIANTIIDDEVFKWNKPFTKEEGVSKFDERRGFPETLSSRMNVSMIKFLQNSIKNGFQVFVDKAAADSSVASVGALDIASRDKLTEFKIKLIQEITKFAIANEIDASEVFATIDPLTFDALAEQGMIGDRASKTYAGGQYSVGMLGGYRVQSGSMFLPEHVTGKTAAGKVLAFVGTSKVGLHLVDVVASNLYEVGGSNDKATYLEIADIAGALDYKGKFGKTQSLIITDVAPASA